MYSRDYDFSLIDISSIKPELSSLMNWTIADSVVSEGPCTFVERLAIKDFIFICFMCGNDFLPLIQSVEIVNDGIDRIIKIYKRACRIGGHIVTIDQNGESRFNKIVLAEFFRILTLKEPKYINEKIANKTSYHQDLLLEECTIDTNVDIDMYRTKYTSKHFDSNKSYSYEGNIEVYSGMNACIKYLEGLQWVLGYYLDGIKSLIWYYPYHYSPPVSLLKEAIEVFEFAQYEPCSRSRRNKQQPLRNVTPFEQLLCVLPPESSHLIPEPLRHIMLNLNSCMKQYIPDIIEIDLSGKHADWEGVVLIPMVDFTTIKDVYDTSCKDLNEKDQDRNTPQESKIYTYVQNNRVHNSRNMGVQNIVNVRRIEI
jgi:5'-3' exonuclease